MSEYDNRGQVALWKREQRSDKAPVLGGTVIAHRDIREGEELEISLWKNDGGERAPVLKGKMQDPYKPQQAAPRQERAAASSGDDLPF